MFNTAHIHPMIVHFPIALIIVGFIADVVSMFFRQEKCLSKTGFYLMVLGALAALAAWISGQLFTNEPAQGGIVEVFEKHETAALLTIIIMLAGALLRIWLFIKKREESIMKWIVFALYFLGFCAVSYTGLMGGRMVYNFMMAL